jgi:hypothetical protein
MWTAHWHMMRPSPDPCQVAYAGHIRRGSQCDYGPILLASSASPRPQSLARIVLGHPGPRQLNTLVAPSTRARDERVRSVAFFGSITDIVTSSGHRWLLSPRWDIVVAQGAVEFGPAVL